MMKTFMLIAVSVILFCAYAMAAQSNRPSPSAGIASEPVQKQSSSKKKPSQSDQRAAEKSPFIAKTINPTKTQTEIEEEKKHHEEKTANDRHLVWFTGALVFFTAVLAAVAIWQGWQLKRSVDSIRLTERAYIFSKVRPDREIKIGVETFEAQLYLYNLGKTPAIIKGIAFMGYKSKDCPTMKDFSKPHYPLESFVGSNQEVYEDRYWFHIDGSDWLISTNPTYKIFCIGYIKYITIFGQEHEHGFCFEFSAPHGRFALCPESELNYNT